MSDTSGRRRVDEDAARRGIDIEVLRRGPAGSLQEAASSLGIEPADIVKTLVVKKKDGTFLFALVPGDRQISWAKLRAIAGANKLSMPDAETAHAATGYERGTITPFGSSTAWPVYADQTIRGRRIAMGSGEHGASMFVDADSLIGSFDAVVADITDVID